jgi:predicted 2-oxoglutarate/Fe(II)-dependent dioxygenase YbiX
MFYHLIENFITKDECEFLIKKGVSQGLVEMKSSKIVGGTLYEQNTSNTKNNKRKGTYFINETLMNQEFVKLSNKILDIVNGLKIYNGIEYNGIPKYSFNEYSPGDFLTWHKDSHEILGGATITLIIQLNDNYDDGEIKFIIDDVENIVPKKQGSIFIFDSNIEHCVSKLKDGKRYSINVWPSKKLKRGMI